jgi:hypothetical protein
MDMYLAILSIRLNGKVEMLVIVLSFSDPGAGSQAPFPVLSFCSLRGQRRSSKKG